MNPFDNDQGGGIPMFGKNGTALSASERAAIAKKRGLCVRCGTKTHSGNVLRRIALTNEHVYNGICIKCNPESVPPNVLAEWDRKFRAATNAGQGGHPGGPPATVHPNPAARFKGAARAIGYAGGPRGPGPRPPGQRPTGPRPTGPRPTGPRPTGPGQPRIQHPPHGGHRQPVRPQHHSHQPRSANAVGGNAGNRPNSTNAIQGADDSERSEDGVRRAHSQPIGNHSSYQVSPGGGETSPHSHRKMNVPPPPQGNFSPPERAGYSEDYTGGSSLNEDAWAVVKAIQENRSKPDVLRQKLHRLRNFGDDQAGAIYEVKDVMQQYWGDSRTMGVACGAVWGITAQSDDKKAEAADAGVVENIVDALRKESNQSDVEFVQWAVGALACLARAGENIEVIAGAGGIEVLLDLLKLHHDSAGVFEWVSRALHTLVHQYIEDSGLESTATEAIKKNIVSIVEAGGISVVLNSMKRHSSESIAQIWAAKLLWRLMDRDEYSATERVLKSMLSEDGVSVCVRVMKARSTDAVLCRLLAEILCDLIMVSGLEDSTMHSAFDCITTVVRFMRENPTDHILQKSCCRLLIYIAHNSSEGRSRIKEANGGQAVTEAMLKNAGDFGVVEAAAILLSSLSVDHTAIDSSTLCQALGALKDITSQHNSSTELNVALCGFISNAFRPPNTANGSDIPVEFLLRCFQPDMDDSVLFAEAGRAVAVVASHSPGIIDEMVQTGVVDRLVGCLAASSPDVQMAVTCVLTAVASSSPQNRTVLMSLGCLASAVAVLGECESAESIEFLLGLISALLCSESNKITQLPEGIVRTVVDTCQAHLHTDEQRRKCCDVVRGLLMVSVPNSTSLDVGGVCQCLTEFIDSSSSSVELKIDACSAIWAFSAKQAKNQTQTSVSTMFKSILGLIELCKGEHQPYNSELMSAAAGALASVTGCMNEHPVPLANEDVNVVINILYTLMEFDLDKTELFEKILEAILHLSMVDENTLIQCGVIAAVIDSMVEHEHSESIQERGCSVLALLSSTEDLQVNLGIAETDGIDMLVNALAVFPENKRIQVNVCKALSHLSVDQESRMLISSQGGLMLLVNALNSNLDNQELLEGACSALLNLTSDADEQILVASNVVKSVVDVMEYHPDSAKLQEKGLGVLQNVSMRSSTLKASIADAGGVDAVVATMREFMGSPGVLERAFTTLWSFAVLPQNQVRIAEIGGIDLVINCMLANIGYERVQKQACGCLCTLSSNSLNKTLIRDCGGIDSIVYAMWAHYDSEALQTEACRALSSLAVNVETNEVMVASEAEINAIISAMRRFSSSEKLQEHGCVALRNFLLSSDNTPLISSNAVEVRKLMNRAAASFPERCQERAHQVLASLG